MPPAGQPIHRSSGAAEARRAAAPAPPWRRHLALVALGWTVFAVYGSLVPLNYRPLEIDVAVERFRDIRMLSLDISRRADWVANILLFIPLTFLWMGALTLDRGRLARAAAAVALVPLGTAAALAIEFTQLWFPGRTVSQNDIAAETLGGAIGVALWLVIGRDLVGWLRIYASDRSARGQSTWLLHTYVAAFCLFSVLPLDLTISLNELYDKWKAGRVLLIPFSYPYESFAVFLYQLAADIVLFAPFGAWFLLAKPRIGIQSPVVGTAVVAALLECAQLLVVSRYTDVTDIVVAPVGGWIGARLATRLVDAPLSRPRAGVTQARGWLPDAALIAAYSAMLAVLFWFPFEFTRDADVIRARIDGFMRVPFQALYRGTEFNAINQVLARLLLFAPLGALWVRLATTPGSSVGQRLVTFAGLAYAAALAGIIEFAQVLMPSKIADVTEIGFYFGGAVGGMLVTRRLLRSPASASAAARVAAPAAPAAASAPPRAAQAPATTGSTGSAPWVRPALIAAAVVVAMVAGIGVVLRLPGIPYNVAQLFVDDGSILARVFFALAVLLLGGGGMALSLALAATRRPYLVLPAGLAIGSVVSWQLLSWSVTHESLLDIVGFEVVYRNVTESASWGPFWQRLFLSFDAAAVVRFLEHRVRFAALYSPFLLCLALLLLPVARARLRTPPMTRNARLATGAVAAVWLVFAHTVTMPWAGTDNLVELVSRGGLFPFARAVWLYLIVVLVALTVALLMRVRARLVPRLRLAALVTAVTSVPLGWMLLWWGMEPHVEKYGVVFSGVQFLLGPDRQQTLSTEALFARWVVVQIAATATAFFGAWLADAFAVALSARVPARAAAAEPEPAAPPPPPRAPVAAPAAPKRRVVDPNRIDIIGR